jgi:hypothetical protein
LTIPLLLVQHPAASVELEITNLPDGATCLSSGPYKGCLNEAYEKTYHPARGIALLADIAIKGNTLLEDNKTLLKAVVTSNETLTKAIREQNNQTLIILRAELTTRLNSIPIELAKDEQAYKLLRERLLNDLEAVL